MTWNNSDPDRYTVCVLVLQHQNWWLLEHMVSWGVDPDIFWTCLEDHPRTCKCLITMVPLPNGIKWLIRWGLQTYLLTGMILQAANVWLVVVGLTWESKGEPPNATPHPRMALLKVWREEDMKFFNTKMTSKWAMGEGTLTTEAFQLQFSWNAPEASQRICFLFLLLLPSEAFCLLTCRVLPCYPKNSSKRTLTGLGFELHSRKKRGDFCNCVLSKETFSWMEFVMC